MEWAVSSFTSEHLQQSLQHCNESISYDESTDYDGKSSATGNGHLPHHRDRCGRRVLTHLQQERTDFQTSVLPLQMCMWFYMTRRKHKQWWVWWRGWRGSGANFHVYRKPFWKAVSCALANFFVRQDEPQKTPRRIHQSVKPMIEHFALETHHSLL